MNEREKISSALRLLYVFVDTCYESISSTTRQELKQMIRGLIEFVDEEEGTLK